MYIGTANINGIAGVYAEKSTDDGKTWKVIGAIPRPKDSTAGLVEPHVIELKSGKLLAMIRHEPKLPNVFYYNLKVPMEVKHGRK